MKNYNDAFMSDELSAFFKRLMKTMEPITKIALSNAMTFNNIGWANVSYKLAELAQNSSIQNITNMSATIAPMIKLYNTSLNIDFTGMSLALSQMVNVSDNYKHISTEISKFQKALIKSYSFETITKNWSRVSDAIEFIKPCCENINNNINDNINDVENDSLLQSEKEELQELFSLVFEDVDDSLHTFKERVTLLPPKLLNIFRYIFSYIILPFIVCIAANYLYEAKKSTRVMQEPNISSTIVYNLTINQEFIVLSDSIPYYYMIQIIDPETDEMIIGYIPKRNATPVNDEKDLKLTEETDESDKKE